MSLLQAIQNHQAAVQQQRDGWRSQLNEYLERAGEGAFISEPVWKIAGLLELSDAELNLEVAHACELAAARATVAKAKAEAKDAVDKLADAAGTIAALRRQLATVANGGAPISPTTALAIAEVAGSLPIGIHDMLAAAGLAPAPNEDMRIEAKWQYLDSRGFHRQPDGRWRDMLGRVAPLTEAVALAFDKDLEPIREALRRLMLHDGRPRGGSCAIGWVPASTLPATPAVTPEVEPPAAAAAEASEELTPVTV